MTFFETHLISATNGPHKSLGKWVANQKQYYKKFNSTGGKKSSGITQKRIDKLDSIGFVWSKDHKPVPWEKGFEDLQNHYNLFKSWNVDPNSALGKWMKLQRSEYKRLKKGRDSILTMEQVEKLIGIGFKWKAPRPRTA